jgi:hypothetical protein
MKQVSILAFGLAVLFTGCKKDQEDPAPPATKSQTKTELLTARNWRITASTLAVGNNTQDIFGQVAACNKDDFARFNADHTVRFDAGPERCLSSDPQFQSGTWELTDNETKLALRYGSLTSPADVFTIVSLTESAIKINQPTTTNGVTGVITITYSSF